MLCYCTVLWVTRTDCHTTIDSSPNNSSPRLVTNDQGSFFHQWTIFEFNCYSLFIFLPCYVYTVLKGRMSQDFTALQRKSHLCIPVLGIARPQPQFPHSCVCERFIQSQDRSTYFLQQNRQTDHGNT
jgi:hypothetical protein